MKIEFDPDKEDTNVSKHRISLARAVDLDILSVVQDDRFDYGESRYRAWGLIDGLFYCLAFTMRSDAVRPISLRRAHQKEINRYVAQEPDRQQ